MNQFQNNLIVAAAQTFVAEPEILLSSPFMEAQQNHPFCLEITDYTNLSAAGLSLVSLNDTAFTLPLVDERGYNVRADRLLREIMKRAAACRVYDVSLTASVAPEKFAVFECVIATDPNRIVICDCLPRSTFIGTLAANANPAPEAETE